MVWLRTVIAFFSLLFAMAGHCNELPAPLTAALLVKVIDFEENLTTQERVSILVVEDELLFDALQRYGGGRNARQIDLQKSDSIPAQLDAQVVFLGSKQVNATAISQIQQQGKLVLSDHYELLKKGVHLVLFNDSGVPGIAIRVAPAQSGSVKWNPEILNYAIPVSE